jgi:4-hydroxybenzoate polyprenyltransferase
MRKYDALAISLLIFSVVLVSAISVDPKGFALRDWQPLIAAFVALGAAALAYNGAMAKVQFDREGSLRTDNRKRLGLYLKVSYAAFLLRHELIFLRSSKSPNSVALRLTQRNQSRDACRF